jgi:GlpG protein
MRQIGSIAEERDAQRLADFLLTCGIKNQVEPAGDEWAIWVYDEDRVQEGRERLAEFRRNPDDPRFAGVAQAAEKLRAEQIEKQQRIRKQKIDVRARWERAQGPGGRPLTWFLIVISAAVAFSTNFGEDRSADGWVQRLLICSYDDNTRAYIPLFAPGSDVARGEFWRLVTPIILHFNTMHLLFNAFAMYSLGGILEMRLGTWRLLLMVLSIAVLSNLAEYAVSGPTFGGLSGVVFGLFGFLWIKGKFDPGFGIMLDPRSVVIGFGFLFLCLTGAMGNIANAAHFGGLGVGIVWSFATLPRR